MKILAGEEFQTVLKLPDGIKIQTNIHNWILLIPPRSYSYFSTLDSLFEDLLNYKIKVYAIQNEKNDIGSLRNSIEKARKEVLGIVKSLTTVRNTV